MRNRLTVHQRIVDTVPKDIPVIFRPSQKHNLPLPCVVYDAVAYKTAHANDIRYTNGETYEVTVMSSRPGVSWHLDLLDLPGTSHLRTFTHDDIVHDIYRTHYMLS